MGHIYKIWNDVDDKVYVGKTCQSIERRFQIHKQDMLKAKNKDRPVYVAMKKYGVEHFFISELEECDDYLLGIREISWIRKLDSYRNGYNATFGGEGKQQYDHELILEELLFCPYASIVANVFGCSADTVRNIARENHIQLRSSSQENLKQSRARAIYGETEDSYCVFDSVADAAVWLHNNGVVKVLKSGVRSHISDCARGKRRTAYGYRWSYI